MPVSRLTKQTRAKMTKTLESTVHDFSTVRTGKANPAMLDVVRVDYYGAKSPISQVATVSTPQPDLMIIQPWDKSQLAAIEKAIRLSDLGLNPSNDGNALSIVVPPLNEERRREFVKVVKKMAEDGRVAIRNQRREAVDILRKHEKAHEISEDESHKGQKEIQSLTDEFIKKLDEALVAKEEDIMEV